MIKPPCLNKNDTVALITPSKTIIHQRDKIERGRSNFSAGTGLPTVLAPHAAGQHYYSGGTIQERLGDLYWALENPDVAGVIFSSGGDTCIELVDKIDYEFIKRHPKVIAGISDATTLLNPIYAKTGLISFLGIELMDFADDAMSYECDGIKSAWFSGDIGTIKPNPQWRDFDDRPTTYAGWRTIRSGVAEGNIIGGNYSSFAQLYHTEYMPDVTGNILVTEFYKMSKAMIHSCLAQLRLWGAFDKISGLILGYCLGSDDPAEVVNDRDLADLVLEATAGYDFPIMQIGEIGHRVENFMLPIGAQARLDASNRTFEITEKVVS